MGFHISGGFDTSRGMGFDMSGEWGVWGFT